jgi:hypothetical protein
VPAACAIAEDRYRAEVDLLLGGDVGRALAQLDPADLAGERLG